MSFIHDIYEFRKSFRHIEKLAFKVRPFEKCRGIYTYIYIYIYIYSCYFEQISVDIKQLAHLKLLDEIDVFL